MGHQPDLVNKNLLPSCCVGKSSPAQRLREIWPKNQQRSTVVHIDWAEKISSTLLSSRLSWKKSMTSRLRSCNQNTLPSSELGSGKSATPLPSSSLCFKVQGTVPMQIFIWRKTHATWPLMIYPDGYSMVNTGLSLRYTWPTLRMYTRTYVAQSSTVKRDSVLRFWTQKTTWPTSSICISLSIITSDFISVMISQILFSTELSMQHH